VLDVAGSVQLRLEIEHSREGLERLIGQLRSFERSGGLAIAIDRPSGVLVDALIEAGFRVAPIHPNVLKASRPRYRGAGKNDPGDVYMLADLLRTDGHRFRPLEERLSGFLAQHGYCGRRPAGAILERLVAELAKLSARIEHTVADLGDGQIIMSFPRSGCIFAAQIPAELGSVRERFPTEAAAGVAPVTFQSGKQRSADPHAILVLARARARALWRAWFTRTP